MRKLTKAGAVVFSLLTLMSVFTSCARQVSADGAYAELRGALENSLQYKTYYIQEMVTHDKLLDKTTVNLRCELDAAYQPIVENGKIKDYKAEIHVSKNDIAKADIFCGVSKTSSGAEKEALFRTEYREQGGKSEVVSKTVEEVPIEDYISENEFQQNYAIYSFLSELNQMKEDDFDFTGNKAKSEFKNNLTVLSFSVTDDYLSRYEIETGEKSVFAGSDRVEVELIYKRVASVVTFCSYSDAMFNQTFEESPYKLFITYYGPKFDIPQFDAKTNQGAPEWELKQ